jgi:hypothetical protein
VECLPVSQAREVAAGEPEVTGHLDLTQTSYRVGGPPQGVALAKKKARRLEALLLAIRRASNHPPSPRPIYPTPEDLVQRSSLSKRLSSETPL